MKFIFIPLTFILIYSSLLASVDEGTAMEVFAGEYRFTDDFTGTDIYFIVDSTGDIALSDNDTYYEASTVINLLGNNYGPIGLPIMNIMLAGGSDEQTVTLHIRIYPKQYSFDDVAVGLIDFVYTENDGPNGLTFVNLLHKNKLYKVNSSGQIIQVEKE